MSKRMCTIYLNQIKTRLIVIKDIRYSLFSYPLSKFKLNSFSLAILEDNEIDSLNALYLKLPELKEKYNKNSNKMKTLFKGIDNIYTTKIGIDLAKIKVDFKTENIEYLDDASVKATSLKEKYKKKEIVIKPKITRTVTHACKYTYEDFLSLANWQIKSSVVKEKESLLVKTKTGFEFYVGSEQEKYIFNKFNKDENVVDIRGQDYIITFKKGEKEYHPDLCVYYLDGTIGIYEVKPPLLMAMHEVLKKYMALERDAIKHNFKYDMLGMSSPKSKIINFQSIINRKENASLKKHIDSIIDLNEIFTSKDLEIYCKEHNIAGNGNRNKVSYDLASIIINNTKTYYMYNKKGKSIFSWCIKHPKYPTKIHLHDLIKSSKID